MPRVLALVLGLLLALSATPAGARPADVVEGTWNTSKLASGVHALRAAAVDAAGHVGVHDIAVTVLATSKGR